MPRKQKVIGKYGSKASTGRARRRLRKVDKDSVADAPKRSRRKTWAKTAKKKRNVSRIA